MSGGKNIKHKYVKQKKNKINVPRDFLHKNFNEKYLGAFTLAWEKITTFTSPPM